MTVTPYDYLFTEVELDRVNMHDYQDDIAVPFLRQNPFSGLFIDMGMGKTVSALTVIRDLLDGFDDDEKILITGPMRVACETWPSEFRKWKHLAHMEPELIYVGDQDERLAHVPVPNRPAEKERIRVRLAQSSKQIHIIPHHLVEWLVDYYGKNWPYRKVFIDESSGFKDQKSNRFNALRKIRNTNGLINRLHIFTATPAAETYEHLFAQIYLLDKGAALGNNITTYRKRYFDQNRWTHKFELRPDAEQEILDKIKHLCLVMKDEDYLGTEKPSVLRRTVTLSRRQMDLYKLLETDAVVTLDDGTEIEAETAAALRQKLLQLASGVLYETVETAKPDGESIKRTNKVHHIHDEKIEELKQIVEELQGKPLLVAYHWKSSLDRLQKAFPKAVVMDKEAKCKKDWNKGKIQMLLMHPQSGGHGLNLQEGGHHMVFFDLHPSLELFLQFVGRLARQGQKHHVMCWLLIAKGTADVLVADSLVAKEDRQDKFFKWLKKKIAEYRRQKEAKAAEMALIDDDL